MVRSIMRLDSGFAITTAVLLLSLLGGQIQPWETESSFFSAAMILVLQRTFLSSWTKHLRFRMTSGKKMVGKRKCFVGGEGRS